jgi:A/G-specific adenine glycosylase
VIYQGKESHIADFCDDIWRFYRGGGRRDFAWRNTDDPYAILVSEFMLQQTQTSRVEGYFDRFIATFPTFQSLAVAPRHELLGAWQGLGYNRRALFLQRACAAIMKDHRGVLPNGESLLRTLPGIGPYTAGALTAFVFNQPAVVIETNIRAVFIAEFFPDVSKVSDDMIRPFVEAACDKDKPREWYYALMDKGAALKRHSRDITARGASYVPQTRFAGSVREVRGAILRAMVSQTESLLDELRASIERELLSVDDDRFRQALGGLTREGFVTIEADRVTLIENV